MTRRLLLAAAVALAATPALAQTPGPFYAGANLGLSIFHNSTASQAGFQSVTVAYSTGFAFGLLGGYRLNENFRLEAEISRKAADIDTVDSVNAGGGSLSVWGFMANGYYDITQLKWPVTPFLGAGLGAARGTVSFPGQSDQTDTSFGYQIHVGFNYNVNKQLQLNARYTYQGSQDFEKNGQKLSYGSSNILAGIQYFF